MQLKTGLQARHFRSSVFCGRKELLLVPTLTGLTFKHAPDAIYHSKRKSVIGLDFSFIPLIIWWILMSIFQSPGRSHPAVQGSSWSVMEYCWRKYLARKKQKTNFHDSWNGVGHCNQTLHFIQMFVWVLVWGPDCVGLDSSCLAPQRAVRKNAYWCQRNAASLFPWNWEILSGFPSRLQQLAGQP